MNDFPIPVPGTRFDQRNDTFKRRLWDDAIGSFAEPLYTQVRFQDKTGYRKLDYSLRNAAWNMEYGFAKGNLRSGYGLYSWDFIPEKVKIFLQTDGAVTHSPECNARIIKKAAHFLGADLVGICSVHPNLVYSHELDLTTNEHRPIELPANCRFAVVMAVAMDYRTLRYSPDAIAGAATGLGYSRQAVLANLVAAFIRGLGFLAIPSGNDTAISIPLAMAAGLGELGRNGLLINEKFGPRVRLCKVFTDLPLTLDSFRPFGAAAFCRTCRKCAERCPSGAIPAGTPTLFGPSLSNHSGIVKWYIDPEKCFKFWAKNWMDCSNCIRVCPFNKPSGRLHDSVRFFIRRMPAFNRLLRRMDDLFGYGRPIASAKKNFWETTP